MGTKFLTLISAFTLLQHSTAIAQTKLDSLAWGLKNQGATQQIAIDHYTSGNIAGVIGEDIHSPPPVSGSRKVIVAVLDTGIDYNHPQLKNALISKGYNVLNNTNDASDSHGHGTHISGIIAARLDASGFEGVSQNAFILPIKVVQSGPNAPIRPQEVAPGAGTALTENVAKGLEYAINNGAEVINLSLAWPASIRSKQVDAAMEHAKQKNVVIVSSAGNDSTTANVYPCIYENVICVGTHGPDGAFSHFSNYGSMVDVLAPGTAILSTWPLNKAPVTFAGQVGYEFRNGTSMSSPFVAGAIAELLSRGYSPEEAKNRILLGSRSTKTQTLFSSPVIDSYSKDNSSEKKQIRFGNLDITQAISIQPSPLILPSKKSYIQYEWDGVSKTISLPISFTNYWIKTSKLSIQIENTQYELAALSPQESVSIQYPLSINDDTESLIHLSAKIVADDYTKTNIDIPVQITRVINKVSLPAEAKVENIKGISTKDYHYVRSVVNVRAGERPDFLMTRNTPAGVELALLQGSQFIASAIFEKLNEDQFLSAYRLPDQSYAAIFNVYDTAVSRPSFVIKKLNSQFKFNSELKVGTDITVLSENFKWVLHHGVYTPLWISFGFTPKLDQLKYDPWNPKYVDLKMPRIFYLDGNDLRIISLKKNQLPLQVFPDGRILISEGSSYFQNYFLLTVQDGKILKQTSLDAKNYRMLIGLDSGSPLISLNNVPSNQLAISGSSNPGNLRVSVLGEAPSDQILERSTQLDSLVAVTGSYQDQEHRYFFVQTNYYLQFFTSGKKETFSTSLNRYSYIPSMIFSRSFFPTLVKDQYGSGLPAIYTPGSIANAGVSEIIFADLENQKIKKLAKFRFLVNDPDCNFLGNLVTAGITSATQQVLICNDQLIQIPLTVQTHHK